MIVFMPVLKKMRKKDKSKAFILWFDEINHKDVPLVGGKNASLGEMYSELSKQGVNVPYGFAITAYAYDFFVERTGIKDKIYELLDGLDTRNVEDLARRGKAIRELFLHAEFPEELKKEVVDAYLKLSQRYGTDAVDVAVRSSATAEDLPDASFAGQQETYLNVVGVDALLDACKKCFASLFTDRAISYRVDKGFDHFKVKLSIGVQKMVRSDLGASGVMFTLDTETGFRNVVLINGSYGLGEYVVQGKVTPDQFYVFKPTVEKGYRPIISKKLGDKRVKLVYAEGGGTREEEVSEEERKRFCLSDDEILQLARWGVIIEKHYSKKLGRAQPMDIEWAKDGITGELFIVQARPETVHSQKDVNVIEYYHLDESGKVLVEGLAVGSKIATGRVRVIEDVSRMHEFQEGEILVTDITDPDWEPIMKIASAIVTNRGGRTSHAAIVARELGIPAVVGTGIATQVLKTGQEVTVSCAEGEKGKVYEGKLKYEVRRIHVDKIPNTRTMITLNVGEPEKAFAYSFLPNDGVGLAREEFIINDWIKIHPNALLEFDRLRELGADEETIRKIEELTAGYEDKKQYFVDKLAEGIGMIAAAFYPKEVIVRFSDFKSNEYARLIGGHLFEPKEENPMLGWRGASRYYSEKFRFAFALECKAIKKVRDEFGLKNVSVMIPFCRTVYEAERVIQELKLNGLKRGENGLKVYVMCEIPSNVVLAEKFLEYFDGFSIGTNDLTQLTLGLDRDSELVSYLYDERNEAVKKLVEIAIKKAHKMGKKIGICGDAPSTHPDFARFLVDCGIDYISVSPDVVLKTRMIVAKEEKTLGKRVKR